MSAPYHPPAVPTTGTLDALPSPLLVRGLSVVLPAHDEVETLAEVVREALLVGAACAGVLATSSAPIAMPMRIRR